MRRSSLHILLFLLAGCSSFSIDIAYNSQCRLSGIDTVYISSVRVNAEEVMAIDESLCRMLAFSLQQKQFQVESYLDGCTRADEYRYHLNLAVFVTRRGVFDDTASNALFLRLMNSEKKEHVMTVQLSCRGDIREFELQREICDEIVSRFDIVIR